MLTWRRDDGIWRGNGFRIEQGAEDWLLFENTSEPEDESLIVHVDPMPLASTSTLTACKLWAEALHRSHQRSRQRQILGGIAAGTMTAPLLFPPDPIVTIILLIVAGAASLELVMTWWEPWAGNAREVSQ